MKPNKAIAIGALAIVICIAAYCTVSSPKRSREYVPPEKRGHYLCVDAACGKSFEETDLNLDDTGIYGETGVAGIKCPACGQFSVFCACKCESCGTLFVPTAEYLGPRGDFKCPKCGRERVKPEQSPPAKSR